MCCTRSRSACSDGSSSSSSHWRLRAACAAHHSDTAAALSLADAAAPRAAWHSAFNGADLRGAQFENAILTAASFGRDASGTWANLAGAHFEGALLSSSDIGRVCENPTLEDDTKRYELGCRSSR